MIYIKLGFYELWLIEQKSDKKKDFPEKLSQILQNINMNLQESQLCGAFQSEFGNANTTAIIWQHQSFDFTKNLREEWSEKGRKRFLFFQADILYELYIYNGL